MLPTVVALLVLVAAVALLGFLADRFGDSATDLDIGWRLEELQRRYDRGERADEVPGTATHGALLAVVGAAVATLALLTAPFVALPFVDGGTLPAALSLLEGYSPAVDLLWALPVGTALIAFNGFRLLIGADRGARWCRGTSTGTATGCLVVLAALLGLVLLPGPAASWLTTDGGRVARAGLQVGYYLCVAGVAAALAGTWAVARRLPAATRS